MSVEILKSMAESGFRIFTKQDLLGLSIVQKYSKSYMSVLLNVLSKKGEVISLGKGLYSLPLELLSGGPIHPFEVAMCLAKKGAISHRSAMGYHHLTDQVISDVYVTCPYVSGANKSKKKHYHLEDGTYTFIRIDPRNYWGIEKVFIGETQICVTNLERTLLDGLHNPEWCGGMREVLFAFEKAIDRVSESFFLEYVKKMPKVISKRLGLVLDKMDVCKELQAELQNIEIKSYQRLDPMGVLRGKYNKKWKLVDNLS